MCVSVGISEVSMGRTERDSSHAGKRGWKYAVIHLSTFDDNDFCQDPRNYCTPVMRIRSRRGRCLMLILFALLEESWPWMSWGSDSATFHLNHCGSSLLLFPPFPFPCGLRVRVARDSLG